MEHLLTGYCSEFSLYPSHTQAQSVPPYRLPRLIPSTSFQIHYEIIRLYGVCVVLGFLRVPFEWSTAWMTQGQLQRFSSFEWGLMNREWAERKRSCPSVNCCSKRLPERPKWWWTSKKVFLELTRLTFGLCSEKTKHFWKNEGRVKGRHVSLAQIIICSWKQSLNRC